MVDRAEQTFAHTVVTYLCARKCGIYPWQTYP
jgi:hypothetical protein